MDRKQAGMGGLILVAITIVVGVILLQASAQNMDASRNLRTASNVSLGTVVNGTSVYITNYKSCSSFVIWNTSATATPTYAGANESIPSTNYTVTNNVVYNGQEAIQITPNLQRELYPSGVLSYDGTCQELEYVPDSGSRAIVGIILIFFALAIAVVALYPVLKETMNWR